MVRRLRTLTAPTHDVDDVSMLALAATRAEAEAEAVRAELQQQQEEGGQGGNLEGEGVGSDNMELDGLASPLALAQRAREIEAPVTAVRSRSPACDCGLFDEGIGYIIQYHVCRRRVHSHTPCRECTGYIQYHVDVASIAFQVLSTSV